MKLSKKTEVLYEKENVGRHSGGGSCDGKPGGLRRERQHGYRVRRQSGNSFTEGGGNNGKG